MKPYFTLSKKIVLTQYEKVKELCDVVSYSSKTNPLVTPILEENTGALFSVHLINELKHVKDKSRVLFLAQALTQESIKELIELGVCRFVVDNESDLNELVKFLNENDVEVSLMLRVKLKENTLKTERFFVFGLPSETVNNKIRELSKQKGVKALGIHFHRKTQNMSEWDLVYDFTNIVSNDVLKLVKTVNIGGGLPSEYANTNVAVLEGIYRRIREFKEFLNEKNIQLMIEPGRFIAAPAGKLVTRIIGKHENNLIVNASIYNSDLDAVIVPVKLLVEGELSEGTPFVIKGVTPCSVDLFRYRVYLENPKVGDELVFLNAGAYNFASDFCDLEKLETKII
ncbi:decarboxylase [Candidatus Micrarchaeota archaeon]|nr:decarboxylase [Candidatus Micrarchaeota archaeon]